VSLFSLQPVARFLIDPFS